MKKAFLFVMMLLSFAAMAIGANFTDTPAKERDDGELIAQQPINTAEVQLQHQISTLGAIYLQADPPPRWAWTATENNPKSTATPRQYWPSGNSKASCKTQDGLNYYNISVSHKISDWPTSCSIARTCNDSQKPYTSKANSKSNRSLG